MRTSSIPVLLQTPILPVSPIYTNPNTKCKPRSEYVHPHSPAVRFRIDSDLERKRIGFTRSDGWYVFLLSVGRGHYLHSGFHEHCLHSTPDLRALYTDQLLGLIVYQESYRSQFEVWLQ